LIPQGAESWKDNKVLYRWGHLFTGLPAVQQWRSNKLINLADYETLNRIIEQYRNRLEDLDWFMKFLNEPLARQTNKEEIFEFSAITGPTKVIISFKDLDY
jgi:hypothetical protein